MRDLVTRRVHAGVPSILVTLSNMLAVMLLAGALSLFEGWQAFTAFELGLLAVAAVFLSSAYYLLVISTRHGDLSLVAPFRYSALLFATIIGFVVWGDTPNLAGWCGIALIVASGIYQQEVREVFVSPPNCCTTRADIGTGRDAGRPDQRIDLPPRQQHISLPNSTPPAVSRQNATAPSR